MLYHTVTAEPSHLFWFNTEISVNQHVPVRPALRRRAASSAGTVLQCLTPRETLDAAFPPVSFQSEECMEQEGLHIKATRKIKWRAVLRMVPSMGRGCCIFVLWQERAKCFLILYNKIGVLDKIHCDEVHAAIYSYLGHQNRASVCMLAPYTGIHFTLSECSLFSQLRSVFHCIH